MNRLAQRLDALERRCSAALPLIVIYGDDAVPKDAGDRLVVRVNRDIGCRERDEEADGE